MACRPVAIEKEAPAVNEITIGSKFRINLPENHDGGYGWQLAPDFDKTVVQELNAVWHGKEKGIDFNFIAKAPGFASLKLFKRKYTDTAGMKLFVVKIIHN